MLTVSLLFLLIALLITIAHAMGKAILWPAVLLLIVVEMLHFVPR